MPSQSETLDSGLGLFHRSWERLRSSILVTIQIVSPQLSGFINVFNPSIRYWACVCEGRRSLLFSGPLFPSVVQGGRASLLPSLGFNEVQGSNVHVWALSTHSEDSPDSVLALEGSLTVRETQVLACH